VLTLFFALLSAEAVEDRAWSAAAILGTISVLLTLRTLDESAGAEAVILRAIKTAEEKEG
jgi:hypothetical protein